ncbi:MAG: peroxidase [Anaerolineales bacterium]|nr:peroxidase [Anaerolineales bacterium]
MKGMKKALMIVASIVALGSQSFLPYQTAASASGEMTLEIEPFDGRGNNSAHPEWGSVEQQLLRMSPVDYGDGISSPSGSNRPSARVVSNTFSVSPADGIPNDRDFTAFVYAWGQFIDHDITLTDAANPKESMPVLVPSGDEWFDPNGTGTMTISFSRSKFDPSTGTSVNNPREQVNDITAFIDGSQVYGSDAERAAALREFRGGRMKMNGNFLTFNTDGLLNFNDSHILPDDQLYLSGDARANENPELLSLHTLFTREHNRIAGEAAILHPDWTDEELYQYARRIVIAEIQRITYEEFLPAILGRSALPAYRGYRADVDPGIATEFSTAAYRLGHSMLGDDIEFLDNDGEEVRDAMGLRDSFFNPVVVRQTDIDPILKYLASDNAQEIDPIVVDDVRNFLFGAPGQGGFDLASMNIQRGRDHGLADYNTVRAAYGLRRVTSFAQITSDTAMQAKLAATYGNVDNIDLWIGGLAEDHLPGSSVGETFTAILVDQFSRLRDGDRFWYQSSLPSDLVREINSTSLADIIRRNTKLTKLQANVFFFNDSTVMIDSSSTAQTNSQTQPQQPPQPQPDDDNDPQNNNGAPPPPPRPNGRPPRPNGRPGRGGGGGRP